MEIGPVGCIRGLKYSVGLCYLYSAVETLQDRENRKV